MKFLVRGTKKVSVFINENGLKVGTSRGIRRHDISHSVCYLLLVLVLLVVVLHCILWRLLVQLLLLEVLLLRFCNLLGLNIVSARRVGVVEISC